MARSSAKAASVRHVTREPVSRDVLRMNAAIDQLEHIRDEMKSRDFDTLEERITSLESQLADKVAELSDANGSISDLLDQIHDEQEHVDRLARARTMFRDGRTADGLHELERVLSDLDSCWRLRS